MSMEEATNQYQSALKQGLREQREALAGGLDMRGAFVRNPGMVVD